MSTAFDPSLQLGYDDDEDDELFFDTRCEQEDNEDNEDSEDEDDKDEDDADSSSTSDVDIVKEVKANFFARHKKPKRLVCPFSEPSRVNRCLSHAEAKSRKDVIEKHLHKVKSNGGDEQHPLNDPLWHSFDVVWFLTPRPKFTPKKRKLAKGSAQSRYYKRRKDKQEREEAEAKRKFDEGIMGEEEYKKYLIGDKRRKFIAEKATERRVRAEMQSQMEAVRKEMETRLLDERKLRADIENKLQDRRTETTSSGNLPNDNARAIASLEAAQQELDDTGISAAALQEVLADQTANVVNF